MSVKELPSIGAKGFEVGHICSQVVRDAVISEKVNLVTNHDGLPYLKLLIENSKLAASIRCGKFEESLL